jgi:hypothetical protein
MVVGVSVEVRVVVILGVFRAVPDTSDAVANLRGDSRESAVLLRHDHTRGEAG